MEYTIEPPISQYNHLELQPLIEMVEQDCYDKIIPLCNEVETHADVLIELEPNAEVLQYAAICQKIASDILHCIILKKEDFVPYLKTLSERDEEGHDCTNCNSGSACNLKHDLQMIVLKETNAQIKDMLNRLQMAALPLYTETIKSHVYKLLRNQMALLNNSLTHLIFVEELYLIPRIKEAQKKINART